MKQKNRMKYQNECETADQLVVCVTLQRVEDGEQVHEGEVDGPPGEQSEAPRHPQQEGEADHAAQVS